MADALVYLYAVTGPAIGSALPPDLVGVGGAPVRVLAGRRLVAVVSSVDPAEFNEQSLQRNLEDLGWLAASARAHHRVIDTIWREQPVAPLRLATVYLDDDNVRAVLDANEAAFAAALERIRGRSEWGVKAFAVPPRRAEAEPDEAEGSPAAGPGRAYLMRKRAERDRAARVTREVHDAAEDLHRSLSAVSVASHRYPPQDPRLSGRPDEMVVNATYLVDDAAASGFQDAVAGWRSEHLHVELTGPWAPYSFASLEEP